MDAVGQKVIIIPHNTVIVAGAMNLFLLSASIGDFAAVGGAVSYTHLDVYKRQAYWSIVRTVSR